MYWIDVYKRQTSYTYNTTKVDISNMNNDFMTYDSGDIANVKMCIRDSFISKKAPFDPDAVLSTGNDNQGIDVFGMPTTRSLGSVSYTHLLLPYSS